ncbi:hypothetical protein ACIPYS_19700 [Kitasatospora sp. NPDC089913]|uniref:hypothetical protein n=1 Tax=Streptomycetaceae TaxID=2062 RepID=UPI00087CFAE6|nr:hypothetical protein [Streptomyces sp. TLI_053]SDT01699.1 hypothetical protein SAMN05216371_1104 [Streptomyces sp. TLI_053]
MNTGGTNDPAPEAPAPEARVLTAGDRASEPEERELSTGAAVLVTVLAAVCGALVILLVLHGLGWTAPGLGWLVAKGAVKIGVGGTVGLVAALGWLRARRSERRTADGA